jgi:hypothetical protein
MLPLIALVAFVAVAPCRAQELTFDIRDVSDITARNFKREFVQKKRLIEEHLTTTSFTSLFAGDIKVEVNNDPDHMFSEALVFAWEGQRGHMYFPAARLKERRSAVLHEVTHVHAPNQARFLAEGFPAYLEEKMGNLEAYPTRGDHLECGIQATNKAYKSPLGKVDLANFDSVPTKRKVFLGDQIGLEPAFVPASDIAKGHRRQFSYLVSASFVKFLIETYGLGKFKDLYEQTPLTPNEATQANAARYEPVFFGKKLADLQKDWTAWLKDKEKACD